MDLSKVKLNKNQMTLFNALFMNEGGKLKLKEDSPREIAFFGGFRCGKSFVCSFSLFLICISYPGTKAIVIRQFLGELKDSSIVQFLDDFEHTGQFVWKKSDKNVVFHNGSQISFRSFSDDESKIKSSAYSVSLFVQAEEVDYALFNQTLGRLSSTLLPKPLLLVEGNPSESWCKDRYAEPSKAELESKGILFIEGTTYDNESNISKDYIQTLLDNYPQDYIDKYVFGKWNKTSERVYTAMADHHKCKALKIHSHYYKCIGFDHGVKNDSSLVWMAKDSEGKVYVYDSWQKKQASLNDIYQAANKYGRLPVIFDTSIKNTQARGGDNFGSIYGDLSEMGLWLIDAVKKDKQANILLVNQYFHQNNLLIFEHCEYVWKQHKRYQYKHNKPEEVVKKDDHSVDAVQYALRYLDKIEVRGPMDRFKAVNKGPSLRDYVHGYLSED